MVLSHSYRDVKEERNGYVSLCETIYAHRGLHSSLHVVYSHLGPASTLAQDLNEQTHTVPRAASCCLGRGVEECILNMIVLFHLNN